MNIQPILSKLYPDGYKGGECGVFAHKLVGLPTLGDSYSQKKKCVNNNGIIASQLMGNFRVGDIIITNEGTVLGIGNGHVALVNNIVNGQLILTESNFRKDGKVHHARTLPITSNKIYGVIRRPFLFKLPPFPTLNISVLMNQPSQWNGSIFAELVKWFAPYIKLNIFPVYTYNSLKDWPYLNYGDGFGGFYKTVAQEFIEDQALPLRFPDTHFTLWCICNKQWEGAVFGHPEISEMGFYYPNKNYAVIACDEKDTSPYYPEQGFLHYARHEMGHWLYNKGNRQGLDLTHVHDLQERDLKVMFKDLDWDYLQANL